MSLVRPQHALWVWSCALTLLSACSGSPPAESPTPESSPTPALEAVTLSSLDIALRSATEATVRVELSGPSSLQLKFGEGFLTYTRKVSDIKSSHTLYLYGLEPEASYIYALSLPDGTVIKEGTFETGVAASAPFRVMFDDSHEQRAGNADWVIDNDAPKPSPSAPTQESDWKGAYSAWGFELHQTGRYQVETNRSTFSDSVLSGVDVLIIPEPNEPFTDNEISALRKYLSNGGGVLMMANHSGSDRDSDGWDAVRVWEDVWTGFSPKLGVSFEKVRDTDDPCSNLFSDVLDPVMSGPFGLVRYMGFNAGSLLDYDLSVNDSVVGLAWPDSTTQDRTGLWAVRGYYGTGRFVIISDSSPADDGTGQSGDELYNSWDYEGQQNAAFHLNATAWLAGDVGE
ncbi:MAG: DUF4350 domain-containing protein [Myxococcota bacterium]